MRHNFKHRAISLLLAFALLLSMMPQVLLFTAEAVETEDFKKYIGCSATFAGYLTPVSAAPEKVSNPLGTDCTQLSTEDLTTLQLVIEDCYYNPANDSLWYKVKAAPGHTLPVTLANNPWVFHDYVSSSMGASLIISEPETVSGGVVDANGEPVVDANGDPLVITVTGDLPEGAYVSATALQIADIGENAGAFDIKVFLPNGQEWQPIEDGKTVQVSIPVGVSVYKYTEVMHFLDYLPDIEQNPNVLYAPVDEFGTQWKSYLAEAIRASNMEGQVAYECFLQIRHVNGVSTIEVNSFSVFYYNLTNHEYAQGDGLENDKINLHTVGNGDNGKYYFANRGSEIYFYSTYGSSVEITDKNSNQISDEIISWTETDRTFLVRDDYKLTIGANAEFYSPYKVTATGTAAGRAIYVVVVPKVTVRFETHLTSGTMFVQLPAAIPGEFLGNYEGEPPTTEEALKALLDAGNYPAKIVNVENPKFQLENGTVVTGYHFKGWYLKHEPDKTFPVVEGSTSISIPLSDDTLQVKLDGSSAEYEVVLVADIDYDPHKVTYNYNYPMGPVTEVTEEYLFEESYTVKNPSLDGFLFAGWTLSTSDPVQNWGSQFPSNMIPGGTTVINMYGDVTLTANWTPAGDTPYKVYHYYQNVSGDGYDIGEIIDTLSGTTGEDTSAELAQRLPLGFEVKDIEVKKIAADGSTEVIIRYDRKQVTITFDSQGGTAVSPITGLFGQTITAPTEPTREHYVFMGWYSADNPDVLYSFSTYPANDLILYARWNIQLYTMTFMDKDSGTIYYKLNQGNGTELPEIIAPSKNGYVFGGWVDKDDNPVMIPDTMPDNNPTYYAKWNPITYTVNFNMNGGGNLVGGASNSLTYTSGSGSIPAVLPSATREGYTFGGWYATEDCTGTAYTMSTLIAWFMTQEPTADAKITTEIFAKWTAIDYTITFNNNGVTPNTFPTNLSGKHIGDVITLGSATATGYTFHGWKCNVAGCAGCDGTDEYHKGGDTFTMPAYDITLTAQWNVVTYNITYDLTGGTVSGNPGTYTIESGDIILTNPTKIGYTFAGWTGTGLDGATMNVTIPAGSIGDRSYTATWTPNTDTQYTVYHYLQNLDGSTYAPHLTQTLSGTTGASVTPALQTPVGFTAPSTQTVIISADGSTVVKYYYNRNSYKVTWNVDDATTTEVSYLYGATIVKPADPGKTGHTFAGWSGYTDGMTMPAENLTFTAQWTINQYTVKVDYDSTKVTVTINGIPATGTQTYDYGTLITIIIKPLEGHKITKVIQNDQPWGTIGESGHSEKIRVDKNMEIKVDAELITYTVTYNLGFHYNADVTSNQTEFPNQTKTHGQPLTLHNQNPVATGAVFVGWDINGDKVKDYGAGDTIELNQNVTLTALWDPEPYQVTYMVEGLANSQTIDPQAGFYKNTITLQNPSVTGYTLQSMKAMSGGVELTITDGKITMPAGDVVVTLTYAPNSYTVVFESNDGNGTMVGQPFIYDVAQPLRANDFTRTGYTFAGWNTAVDGSGKTYEDSQSVSNLVSTAGGSIRLYAQWNVVTYNITYDLAGGTVSGNPGTYTIKSGDIILTNPTKIGYTFAGWTGTGLDGATMNVTIPAGSIGDRSYTATWTPNTDTQYTVYHYLQNLDGSTYAPHLTQTLSGTTGASVTPALQTPVGFTAPSTQTVIISADGSTVVNYYYNRNSYKVTWNVDDATTTEVSYLYGATIVKPADPGKTGYTFAGWSGYTDSMTMPAENLTFTAQWTANKYTVTWDVDGTTTTETYEYGATIVKPADPVKEGHTFAGWTPAVPGTMPAENLIFTAQWTANQYTVTFVLGNGQPDIVQTYAYGATVSAPADPTKTGYAFNGWTPAVPATMPAENLTFTATWTEILKKLTINKLVENLGENPIPGGQTFTFIVTMLNGKTYAQYQSGIKITGASNVTVEAGSVPNQFLVIFTMPGALGAGQTVNLGTVIISGLPLGPYKVSEVYKKGYDGQFEGAHGADEVEVNLTESSDATVSCTNQYPVYTGDLTIKNDVSREYSEDTDYLFDEFTVLIKLNPDLDALAVVKKYYAEFNSKTVELDFTDKTELSFTVTMAANETLTISGLPIGGYTVEVVDIYRGSTSVKDLYASSITYDPNNKLITSDKNPDVIPEAAIASTYHRTTGTLTVNKTIQNIGTVDAEAGEKIFTFRVTLPDDVTKADFIAKYTTGDINWIDERSFTFTITIASAVAAGAAVSQSKVFANVPSGDYEVAEIDSPVGFVPIVSPVTTQVRTGAVATATFINQYPVYLIIYQVVGEGGTVTVSGNNGTFVSEKVYKYAEALGATANAAAGYRFVGWFADSACTGTPLSTALTYAPSKPGVGWNENLTVYAKFEPIGSLTIVKVVDNKDDVELTNQSFTFTIQFPAGKDVDDYIASFGGNIVRVNDSTIRVTITITAVAANATASNMVTLNGLPMGPYTIEETGIASGFVSDWSDDTTAVTLFGASASVTATCTNQYPVYRVDYIVEGPGGTVKLNNVAGNAASVYEIYNFVTGSPAGATATAASGYQFDGWYLNGVRVSTELTFTPAKAEENQIYKAKFVEKTADINFVIIGPDGHRYTADTDWVKLTTYSATIGSATGNISSAVTNLSVVYKFMGWYSDEACTNKLSNELTYEPQKTEGLHVPATYYAKFAYNLTSLKLQVNLTDALDDDQSFVLYLTDQTSGQKLTVSVNIEKNSTSGTVTINGVTVGHTYTVTLDNNWSWRYDTAPAWAYASASSGSGFTASLTVDVMNGTLSFTVTPSDHQWLDGNDWLNQWLNGIP